jgi:hypothetical protein
VVLSVKTITSKNSAVISPLTGRDMCAAWCGIKSAWVTKAQAVTTVNQPDLAAALVRVAVAKHECEKAAGALFESVALSQDVV